MAWRAGLFVQVPNGGTGSAWAETRPLCLPARGEGARGVWGSDPVTLLWDSGFVRIW